MIKNYNKKKRQKIGGEIIKSTINTQLNKILIKLIKRFNKMD